MNITCIGYGKVGGAIADRLQRLGHDVTLSVSDEGSPSLARLVARNASFRIASPGAAAAAADVVVLATPFGANVEALAPLKSQLAGKVLIDCTNPVGPGLAHGLGSRQSGTEMIQALLPDTKVVKALSIYGFENFEDSSYPGHDVKPVMMFCGNDPAAKAVVAKLLAELGWEPLDVGGVEQALHLEHMTLLWVRMVRMGGHSPHMVWAVLTR